MEKGRIRFSITGLYIMKILNVGVRRTYYINCAFMRPNQKLVHTFVKFTQNFIIFLAKNIEIFFVLYYSIRNNANK